jgi:hypothetical protein
MKIVALVVRHQSKQSTISVKEYPKFYVFVNSTSIVDY